MADLRVSLETVLEPLHSVNAKRPKRGFVPGSGATIIDDGVADELIGGGNDDLFVATTGIDSILDLTVPEISF